MKPSGGGGWQPILPRGQVPPAFILFVATDCKSKYNMTSFAVFQLSY